MPNVSIIIVNYNGEKIIIECLKSLERLNINNFEIIIVDNGSSDNSINEIRNFLKETPLAPFLKLLSFDKNLGFAAGNLEGLKHAKGRYIALLNNDAIPDNKWLKELTKAMDKNLDVGICASKLLIYGTNKIDSAGDEFSTFLKGFKRGEGEDESFFNKKEYVFGACAGAALYRREMIDEIGFFDEEFFLIHEDTDLNFRAQLFNWKVLYVPTAVVYHKVRSSIGQMSDQAVYYSLRNNEFVRLKNVPFSVFARFFPEFVIWFILEFIYFVIKHKRLKLYLKAKMDVIMNLSEMLKKRKIIQANKRVSDKYIIEIMTPIWKKNFLNSKIKKFFNYQ